MKSAAANAYSTAIPSEFAQLEIAEQKIFNGKPFPLVLQPTEDTKSWTFDQWEVFFKEHGSNMYDLMVEFGAVLFRNFPAPTAEHCDRWVKAIGFKSFRKLT